MLGIGPVAYLSEAEGYGQGTWCRLSWNISASDQKSVHVCVCAFCVLPCCARTRPYTKPADRPTSSCISTFSPQSVSGREVQKSKATVTAICPLSEVARLFKLHWHFTQRMILHYLSVCMCPLQYGWMRCAVRPVCTARSDFSQAHIAHHPSSAVLRMGGVCIQTSSPPAWTGKPGLALKI